MPKHGPGARHPRAHHRTRRVKAHRLQSVRILPDAPGPAARRRRAGPDPRGLRPAARLPGGRLLPGLVGGARRSSRRWCWRCGSCSSSARSPGFSAWSGVAAGALALFGIWILLSSGWSHAPGRALVEFGRLLTYLLILVICASLAPRENRLAWALRGLALAIGIICVAALITRLRPDIYSNPGSGFGRLDYPITYWNGLAMLAGVGAILGLHLSASDREPWPVRVLAAGLPAIAVVTVYLTLSRGGIFASIVRRWRLPRARLLARDARARCWRSCRRASYAFVTRLRRRPARRRRQVLVRGRARAGPRRVVRAAAERGRRRSRLRAVALLLDRGVAALPGPGRLPVAARVAAAAAVVIAVVVVALAAGAPAYADRQLDAFLEHHAGADRQHRPARPPDRLQQQRPRRPLERRAGLLARRRAQGHRRRHVPERVEPRPPAPSSRSCDAHSLYIETLGEMGIVGIALLMTALLAIARRAGVAPARPRPARRRPPCWRRSAPGRCTPASTGTGS